MARAKKMKSKIQYALRKQRKTEREEKRFSPRGLARNVAKVNMRKAGMRRVNRNMADWRSWVISSNKARKARKA